MNISGSGWTKSSKYKATSRSSQVGSSKATSKGGLKGDSKGGSKGGSKSNLPSTGEWSDWEWNESYQSHWRCRQKANGKLGPLKDRRMRYLARSLSEEEHKN
jgi:hypothetical protein